MTPTQLDSEQKVRQPTESTWRVVGVAHTYIAPSASAFIVLGLISFSNIIG